MVASILIGAGAEVGVPYMIPCGKDFTWATCYTSNSKLYKALGQYYATILESPNRNACLPRKYQDTFLYEASSASFSELINGVLDSEGGADIIADFIGMNFLERKSTDEANPKLNSGELETLYDELIKDPDKDSKETQKLKDYLFDDLPEDAYFGTIEKYFSSLLNPSRRNKSFWKLVNYYWNAFFVVAEPMIDRAFSKTRSFKASGLYKFTLNNLSDVASTVSSEDCIIRLSNEGLNYYTQLSGLFDYALTTNYTPYIRAMKVKNGRGPIRLSGSLTQFESVPDLCVYDLLEEEAPNDALLFPFLMTQVPIKPLIDYRQMLEYSHAVEAVDKSDVVVILGYSLCQNDAHIGSLLQAFLRKSSSNKILYLNYLPSNDVSAVSVQDILNRIRMPAYYQDQVNVITFGKGGYVPVDGLRPCLEAALNDSSNAAESSATS